MISVKAPFAKFVNLWRFLEESASNASEVYFKSNYNLARIESFKSTAHAEFGKNGFQSVYTVHTFSEGWGGGGGGKGFERALHKRLRFFKRF